MENLGTVFSLGAITPEQYAFVLLESAVNLDTVDVDGVKAVAASVPAEARYTLMRGNVTVLDSSYRFPETKYQGVQPSKEEQEMERDRRTERVRLFALALLGILGHN